MPEIITGKMVFSKNFLKQDYRNFYLCTFDCKKFYTIIIAKSIIYKNKLIFFI